MDLCTVISASSTPESQLRARLGTRTSLVAALAQVDGLSGVFRVE